MSLSSSICGGSSSSMAMNNNNNSSSIGKTSKSETVNYLLLYEAMVRHQDLEYDATYDHIALTMGRIQYLGRPQQQSQQQNPPKLVSEDNEENHVPKGMLTYLQMRRCLLRLGYTWNRSLFPPPQSHSATVNNSSSSTTTSSLDFYYDDDVSVMSTNSASTFLSANNSTSGGNSTMTTRDIIATDAQLIMLLTTLVEMEEKDRAMKLRLMAAGKKQQKQQQIKSPEEENDNEEDMFAKGLFLPEFVQAYKLIIGGMQSLQTYPNPPTTNISNSNNFHEEYNHYLKACASLGISPGDESTLQELRLRSRERTLGLLRLFGPNSNRLYKDHDLLSADGDDKTSTMQSAGESPTAQSSSARRNNNNSSSNKNNSSFFDDGLQHTPNRSSSTKKKNRYGTTPAMTAKDGLLPRLTEEEIRKMVHSKDTALARILEDHESEMNVMANNMEEMRLRSLATARMLKKRRKRTRIIIGVCFVLSIMGGIAYELRRREQVKVEIMSGREAERQADLATIASLRENVATLKSKLSDAEATIRYEEGRYEEVKDKFQKVTRTLEETEGRWLLDRRDLDHCRVTRKELDRDLSDVKSRNVEVEEEVGWCRERLQGTERALESMERALKSKESSISKVAELSGGQSIGSSGNDKGLVATTTSGVDQLIKADKKQQKGSKHKPVQMEMKYNKSFRNAVILRQVYSAAVGMFVSALFPGIGRVIGFLINM